ncbi:MAG: phosphoribosylformylglycinamidine synthase subunit PurQ [Acidobacteria bacterium]|nr:phosphoribosylformylglycinamidine synthase subunit PurQ [Acidobacteriota bacterium]
MRFGVVVFPGSNCDHDAYHVISKVIGQPVDFIWHRRSTINGADAVILPGGFSYGDYLRAGAIAHFSPVMQAVKQHAERGGLVLGICNGFQILCESGLLPGVLMRNRDLRFICRMVTLRVESTDSPFAHLYRPGQIVRMPIAHAEGNYFCDPPTLEELRRERRIILRYCDAGGQTIAEANPNGALDHIAGICSRERNVLGLMPHPERAAEEVLGSADGRTLFQSMAVALAGMVRD